MDASEESPRNCVKSECTACYHSIKLMRSDTTQTGGTPGYTLSALASHLEGLDGVCRGEVNHGDLLEVTTRNSTYAIRPLGGDRFLVSGGWFKKSGLAAMATTIVGCTWGGHAIVTDILAAPGLFLEFGNTVRTTRIQKVRLVRSQLGQPV